MAVTQAEIDRFIQNDYYCRNGTVVASFAYKLYQYDRISVIVRREPYGRRPMYMIRSVMNSDNYWGGWRTGYAQSNWGNPCLGATYAWFRDRAWERRVKSKTYIAPEGWE